MSEVATTDAQTSSAARGDDAASDADNEADDFAAAIIAGLTSRPMTLPCRYLYDERGSELFEEITRLPEYYPTRTEASILDRYAGEMARGSGEDSIMVEFGSGSSRKTEILLRAMPQLAAYVPIDVSPSALDDAEQRLSERFPALPVRPIVGDFSQPIDLPGDLAGHSRIGFFPGSTIGNLVRAEAVSLLGAFRSMLSPAGRLIVGVDLVKDADTLRRAYDDSAGVTAAFNLNMLEHINRTFGAAFDPGQFRHKAVYNEELSRIEMHLVSTTDQVIEFKGHRIHIGRGETIHTENSHKYRIADFQVLARDAGWTPHRVWTDEDQLFSVHELELPD